MPAVGKLVPCYPYVATIECLCDSGGSARHCVSRLVLGGGETVSIRQEEELEGEMVEGKENLFLFYIGMLVLVVIALG